MASAAASSSSSAPRVLYRSLLRELRSNPSNPPKAILSPAFTSQPIVSYVRESFRASGTSDGEGASFKEMKDLELFLRSNRVHKELLVRYNPLHDQTEAERVKATARRVGLDVPVEYLPNAGKEEEVDTRSSRQRADDYKGKTGPLPPPDLDV